MPLFKVYFKVLRSQAVSLSIYLVIFIVLAIIFTYTAPAIQVGHFADVKVPMAIVNHDEGGVLAEGLMHYLMEIHQVTTYPDAAEELQDALFYRDIEYVAIIPAGFSDDFLRTGQAVVEKVTVPASVNGYYVDLAINRYLSNARLYGAAFGDNVELLVSAVGEDLQLATPVTYLAPLAEASGVEFHSAYYHYFAYAALGLLLSGVGSIVLVFNREDLAARGRCAPLSERRRSLELALGHGVFAFGCWAVFALFSFLFYGSGLLSSGLAVFYLLNSLVFTLVATCIGLLLGSFVRSESVLPAAINVVAMGMSFLCGVFVPQSLLAPGVLTFARFLPAYWYIRANDILAGFGPQQGAMMTAYYNSVLIQLAFAVAIFSVTLFLSRERRLPV